MAISKKLEIIYRNGQPDGIRLIRRYLSMAMRENICILRTGIPSVYVLL